VARASLVPLIQKSTLVLPTLIFWSLEGFPLPLTVINLLQLASSTYNYRQG